MIDARVWKTCAGRKIIRLANSANNNECPLLRDERT